MYLTAQQCLFCCVCLSPLLLGSSFTFKYKFKLQSRLSETYARYKLLYEKSKRILKRLVLWDRLFHQLHCFYPTDFISFFLVEPTLRSDQWVWVQVDCALSCLWFPGSFWSSRWTSKISPWDLGGIKISDTFGKEKGLRRPHCGLPIL